GFAGGQTNLYAYVGDDPVNLIDPFGLGGFGFWIGASADLGLPSIPIQGSVQASYGVGQFLAGEGQGTTLGQYWAHGGFVKSGLRELSCVPPAPNWPNGVEGAGAGIGVGVFYTNAGSVSGLAGAFQTINVGYGIFSFQIAWSGEIYELSLGVAKSVGVSSSAYQTDTHVIGFSPLSGLAPWQTYKISPPYY